MARSWLQRKPRPLQLGEKQLIDYALYAAFSIVTYILLRDQLKTRWPSSSGLGHQLIAAVVASLPMVNALAFLLCVGAKLDSVGK